MNTVHRIYGDRIQLILFSHDKTVGNLPQAVSQEDISKLFNKICPVTEVYVPGATPTGAFVQITLTAYILLLQAYTEALQSSMSMETDHLSLNV